MHLWVSAQTPTYYKYMLLHPCECNIWFTSTEPNGHSPEGMVLVNWILRKQGCNDKFISHLRHIILSVIAHAHCIKDRALFCSVCWSSYSRKTNTTLCNVSNVKGNHSEECKFLQVLYQTSKTITVHWLTHANLLHWLSLWRMPSMRNN